MAEHRTRAAWSRCSSVMALIANLHRDPKKRRRPYTPDDFDPFTSRSATPAGSRMKLAKGSIGMQALKLMTLGKKKR